MYEERLFDAPQNHPFEKVDGDPAPYLVAPEGMAYIAAFNFLSDAAYWWDVGWGLPDSTTGNVVRYSGAFGAWCIPVAECDISRPIPEYLPT